LALSTNTPAAVLLQRDRSEGVGLIEPTQREGLACARIAWAVLKRFAVDLA